MSALTAHGAAEKQSQCSFGMYNRRMHEQPIAVTLCLATGPQHKNALPAALMKNGMLRRLVLFGSQVQILDPDPGGRLHVTRRFHSYQVMSRLLWAAWRRIPLTKHSQLPTVATSWFADRLVSRYIPPCTIFHGWMSLCLASLQRAKQRRAVTMMETATLHFRQWQDEVLAECDRFSIDPRDCSSVLPEPLIRRAEREYETCDRIVVLSSVAGRSFEKFGLGRKVMHVPAGVDHVFFAPGSRPPAQSVFRVCYVGRIELAKGVAYLLQAWKQLALPPQSELLLIGEIKPETCVLMKRYATPTVRVLGVMPATDVAAQYRRSCVFVFPSVNEGLGMVLLEAMASGLPVIGTDRTGAPDLITHGTEGFIVPARNVDALSDAILWCYRHPEETALMGKAARAKVEQHFTLVHHAERQIAVYRSLAV